MNKLSLGCGKKFKRTNFKLNEVEKNPDFICDVVNAWGVETLCLSCDSKMRGVWREDLKNRRRLKCGKK